MHRGNIQMSGYGNISRHYIRWLSGVLLSFLRLCLSLPHPANRCHGADILLLISKTYRLTGILFLQRMRLCECRMEWKSCHILVRRKKRRLLPDKAQVRLPTIVQVFGRGTMWLQGFYPRASPPEM